MCDKDTRQKESAMKDWIHKIAEEMKAASNRLSR